MASKIKGITVEIGGDTTKLGQALDTVSKKSKSLQSELRGVNSLLKMDPSNVTLIQQKQELLNKSIENTKEKLTTLKGTQEQVQQQFDKGEVTEEQFRDFQREIINTENKLKSLTNEAKEFGNSTNAHLVSASAKFEEFGEKTTQTGKKMMGVTAGITAGAVAIGAAAVKSMDAVDEGLDTVMKKTGATGKTAQELQKIYEDVAREVPADFKDIGSAVGEINTRLDFTGQKLKDSSIAFLKFAKVNDLDVNSSVQLVTRAMGDAGIAAENYQSILDMLTVAGQKSGISIDSLATNLAKYGAPMRALGIDTQEAIAMFAGWEKAGVNTEIAFSGMKKAISNWGAAGKDSRVEFQKTLDEIKACPDIASATSKAIEVFGAKAGPDLADAIQGGRFEFESYINALENAGGTIDSTYGMIVDEVDDTQLANQTFQLSLHSLGETISKTIGPILLSLANKFKNLMETFSKMSPTLQKVILVITTLVAAIGPALIIIGKISAGVSAAIKIFSSISKVINTVKGAFTAFNVVLASNPIVLVVAAIAALIAIFVTLWTKCEWFRNFWKELWDKVTGFCQDAINKILGFFNGIINFIKNNWQALLLMILNPFMGAFKLIYDNCDGFRNVIDSVINKIKEIFQGLWNKIVEIFSPIISFFQGIFETLWSIVTSLINVIILLLQNAWEGIKIIFSVVVSFFQEIWDGIVLVFTPVIDFFTTIFTNAWTGIVTVFSVVVSWFQDVWNGITSVFSVVANFFGDIFTNAWNNVKSAFSSVTSFFQGIWNSIVNIFSKIGTSIGDTVSGAFTGVVNGVINWAESIVNKFVKAINNAIGAINNIPGVNIKKLQELHLKRMRTGGTLEEGQAMIAEAGSPEMISISQGKAIVRPLTNRDRKQVLDNNQRNDSTHYEINIEHFHNERKQDVKAFAEEFEFYRQRKAEAKGG